jgi:hypothetical protein
MDEDQKAGWRNIWDGMGKPLALSFSALAFFWFLGWLLSFWLSTSTVLIICEVLTFLTVIAIGGVVLYRQGVRHARADRQRQVAHEARMRELVSHRRY